MKRYLYRVLLLQTMLIASFCTLNVEAAQDLILTGKEKLKATVSSSKINRITFGSGHFSRIVGDSSKYSIVIDELGANLFLTAKTPVGSSFEISIINAAGLVADLVLDVKDIAGQIINIHDEEIYKAVRSKEDIEIASMLKSMIRGDQDKYYVKDIKRTVKTNSLQLDQILNIVQDKTYRYQNLNLTGARLQVTSLSKDKNHITELREEDFKHMFELVKAVSIDNRYLAKNKTSHVWVITKDEDVR